MAELCIQGHRAAIQGFTLSKPLTVQEGQCPAAHIERCLPSQPERMARVVIERAYTVIERRGDVAARRGDAALYVQQVRGAKRDFRSRISLDMGTRGDLQIT